MTIPVRLSELARLLRAADLLVETRGTGDPALEGVCQDSRKVRAGDVFLAWKGVSSDAHAFVESIIRGFSLADAQRVKEIEKVTNHDMKAVEYLLKVRRCFVRFDQC